MKHGNKESGNVLFLILIAVALFAALSYAVTQSTRSGSGSTDREQSLLGSATLTQYPTALRTAVVRMLLSGIDLKDIAFNAPGNFAGVSVDKLVFSPDGGGAVYQAGPADVMMAGGAGIWYHNANFYIPEIGRAGTAATTADLIAFLPGINTPTCRRLNTQMGIAPPWPTGCTANNEGIPISTANATLIQANRLGGAGPIGTPAVLTCGTATTGALVGRPTGCFNHATLGHVFYSVIIEQ